MRIAFIALICDLPDIILCRETFVELRLPISDDGPGARNDLVLAIREAAQIVGLTPVQFVMAMASALGNKLDTLANVCDDLAREH